jgi:hypothetical protein
MIVGRDIFPLGFKDLRGSITADENPEGHNQYSGAGRSESRAAAVRTGSNGAAHRMAVSNEAFRVGREAHSNNSRREHFKAASLHRQAEAKYARIGNSTQATKHAAEAAKHELKSKTAVNDGSICESR